MDEELDKNTSISLPLAHLLVVWDVLSNKLPETSYRSKFTDTEKRAIWALEDLCEKELIANGITDQHRDSWERLLSKANSYCENIPTEFLD